MPTPELPLEVQERIIDDLHDDRMSLVACSLACRAWSIWTRQHRFRSVTLQRKRDYVRFLCILDESLQSQWHIAIGDYVREIHMPAMRLFPVRKRKSLRYELLVQTLRYLPNVEAMWLCQFDLTGFVNRTVFDMNMADINYVNTGDAIRSIVDLPNLKTIYFRDVTAMTPGEILWFVTAFPSLASLEFADITCEDIPSPYGDHFEVDGFIDAAFQDWLPPVRIDELMIDRLHLWRLQWTSSSGLVALSKIFDESKATLEELDVTLDVGPENDWLLQTNPSHHHHLRMLSIGYRFQFDDCHDWLGTTFFLSQIASHNLEKVKLHFYTTSMSLHWDFLDWPQFSKALIDLHETQPSMVLTFHFHFSVDNAYAPEVIQPLITRVTGILETGMPVEVVRSVFEIYDVRGHTTLEERESWRKSLYQHCWLSASRLQLSYE